MPMIPSKGFEYYLCKNDGGIDFGPIQPILPKITPVDNKLPRNEDGLTEEQGEELSQIYEFLKAEGKDWPLRRRYFPATFAPEPEPGVKWERTGEWREPEIGEWFEAVGGDNPIPGIPMHLNYNPDKRSPHWILKKMANEKEQILIDAMEQARAERDKYFNALDKILNPTHVADRDNAPRMLCIAREAICYVQTT